MLKIVPKPGFCLINIHKKSTDTLIKKVAAPIDKLVVLDIPSASTDHGEFSVVDRIKRPSPNPKIAKPKIKKKDVYSNNFFHNFSLLVTRVKSGACLNPFVFRYS